MANNLSFSNSRFSQHAADLFILLLLFTLLLLLLLLLLMVGMITHDFLRPPFSCSWSATRLISETRTMASSLCFLRRSFHPSRFCTIIVRIRIGIDIVRFRPFSSASPSTMCFQRKAGIRWTQAKKQTTILKIGLSRDHAESIQDPPQTCFKFDFQKGGLGGLVKCHIFSSSSAS